MRWRVRALAYLMLLGTVSAVRRRCVSRLIQIVDPDGPRDRLTVGLRLLLGIPHFIVLVCLLLVWWITSLVVWLMILFTGDYPQRLYAFGAGCLAWLIRVEAYVLLLVDEYPPFSCVSRARGRDRRDGQDRPA